MKFDIWGSFRKSVEKIQISLKSDKNNRYFKWSPIYIYDNISLSSSYNKLCLRKKLYREIKTYFMFKNNFFFWKSGHLWDNVETYGTVGQAKNDNMAHAHSMLDT